MVWPVYIHQLVHSGNMELKSRATPEYINCFCFDETRGFNIEDQKDIKWKDVFKMKINNLRHYLQSIYSTFENLIVCVCGSDVSQNVNISCVFVFLWILWKVRHDLLFKRACDFSSVGGKEILDAVIQDSVASASSYNSCMQSDGCWIGVFNACVVLTCMTR